MAGIVLLIIGLLLAAIGGILSLLVGMSVVILWTFITVAVLIGFTMAALGVLAFYGTLAILSDERDVTDIADVDTDTTEQRIENIKERYKNGEITDTQMNKLIEREIDRDESSSTKNVDFSFDINK